MTLLFNLSEIELKTFHEVIQRSLSVRRHQDLFNWLHGDFQQFVPHDILLTAWGNFSLGIVQFNVVSSLPGLRTSEVDKQALMPFLKRMFERWSASAWAPMLLDLANESEPCAFDSGEYALARQMAHQRTALVHGIKDERGRHDCLYIAMSAQPEISPQAADWIVLLLPYIDTALRQVAHLPAQYPDMPEEINPPHNRRASDRLQPAVEIEDLDLSERECEIMHLVCLGKTNSEIGTILDISFFTVKNHMQRIFRRLDVLNRAQAVAKYEKLTKPVQMHRAVANMR